MAEEELYNIVFLVGGAYSNLITRQTTLHVHNLLSEYYLFGCDETVLSLIKNFEFKF